MLNNHAQAQQCPVLVGHRGFPAKYPENTLAGFRAALVAGAPAVECDIQFSHDGQPMVIHDSTLKRTTGQAGRVVDFTAAQLQGVSAHEPKRLGAVGAPEFIPLLSELVALLQAFSSATLFVEIKHESFAYFDRQYCVEKIVADVQALGPRAVIISFDAEVLHVARQYGIAIGWVIEGYNNKTHQQAVSLSPEFLIADYKKLPIAPAEPWAGNWQWFIYDLVDAPLARNFVERGVRYIETWDIASMLSAKEFQGTANWK